MTLRTLVILLLSAATLRAQPNIVLILADDLGYGDLSSYGAPDMRTPNIDGLVEQGMRFDRFYANSPVCSPTRASLLSGRYPPFAGVPGVIRTHADDSWGRLSPDVVLLPELLKRNGYFTGMVGKWHLGLSTPNTPLDRGFDVFRGFLGDMMDDYYTHRRWGINYMRFGRNTVDAEGHAMDLFSDWAASFITEASSESAPYFLYLAYNAPHTPIQPPEESVDRVLRREPGIEEERARLVALIEHMDDGIGRVMDAVYTSGEADQTIVVFVSDNGGQTNVGARNGAVRAGKGTMYEGGIRVPACFVWPEHVEPGSHSESSLLTMDLYPTLAQAAGVPITHSIDGTSFLDLALGRSSETPERTLFFSRREGNLGFGGKTIEAVRMGPWKLVHNSPYAPMELYNLESDPLETTDLSSQEPATFRRLAAELRRYVRLSGSVPWQDPGLLR